LSSASLVLRPDWPAQGVGALMSTRSGGVSAAPFDSLNVRDGIGDRPTSVARNREILGAMLGAPPVWLDQVHGRSVARLGPEHGLLGAATPVADASVTTQSGIACAVQVADCLPVLFAAPAGRAVGAAHAGWRGLAAGVLEATVAAQCTAAECRPHEILAWLGPCIGPEAFEVGFDVVQALDADTEGAGAANSPRFVPRAQAGKWLADLPGLARDRLHRAGLTSVSGGRWCTVGDASRFFSYRRDGVTGRMAAVVWIDRP
jgi:YfiH family protein